MKTCPVCGQDNPPGNKFCQNCGAALDAAAPPPADRTILAAPGAGPVVRPRAESYRTRPIKDLFAGGKTKAVIGRAADCDIILSHPTVSRKHAELELLPDGRLVLRDLGSSNGIFVEGEQLETDWIVQERARVGIGPFLFSLDRGLIHSFDSSQSLRLHAANLEKEVTSPQGKKLKLIQGVNLVVEPGEFVALLGPSGSGKSTLMDCLNGRRRATGGRVLANGEDFYRHFDSFRQSLGYVPQKDIVHTELSVERALTYTAELRLPRDTTPAELRNRVEDVIRDMGLAERRQNVVATLSGGQLKRVSLGAELLARPSLLYIDEATSGLDAGKDAEMMKLFRDMADREQKSIICITHNLYNIDRCHLVLVLNYGKMVFYGPPQDALTFFKVPHISAIYSLLEVDREDAWHHKFLASDLHREYVKGRMEPQDARATIAPGAVAPAESKSGSIVVTPRPAVVARPHHPPLWHQFQVLTRRYTELLIGDRRSLLLLLLQAPLVGLLLLVGFIGLSFRDLVPKTRPMTTDEKQALVSAEAMLKYLLNPQEPPEVLKPWLSQPVEVGSAEQNIRKVLDLKANTHITRGDVVKFLKSVPKDDVKVLPADQREQLTNLLGSLPATDEEVQNAARAFTSLAQMQDKVACAWAKQVFEAPPDVRAWIGKTLHRSPETPITGADVVLLRQKIDGKEITDVPRPVREWLSETPHAPATREQLLKVFGDFDKGRVVENMVKTQAPIVPEGDPIPSPRNSYILLSILAIVVFWLGCNNAAKEIVKEGAIYSRERAVNLGIVPYLGSKFLVLGLISAVQVLLLMTVVYGSLHAWNRTFDRNMVLPVEYCLRYDLQYLVLALLALTGVAAGLLLSASVSNPDRASVLLPYMLIPQIILCGSMVSVSKGVPHLLAVVFSPVYWAYQAIHLGARTLPVGWPGHEEYGDNFVIPSLALLVQLTALLLLTVWALRRKDVGGDLADWLTRLRRSLKARFGRRAG